MTLMISWIGRRIIGYGARYVVLMLFASIRMVAFEANSLLLLSRLLARKTRCLPCNLSMLWRGFLVALLCRFCVRLLPFIGPRQLLPRSTATAALSSSSSSVIQTMAIVFRSDSFVFNVHLTAFGSSRHSEEQERAVAFAGLFFHGQEVRIERDHHLQVLLWSYEQQCVTQKSL